MVARLIAEEGLLKELVLYLDEGDQWTIGRDPDSCELLVEDPSASRQHARCVKIDTGILIENLSHTNPTQVNDQPLTGPRLLLHGDSVRIGDTLFRFYTEDPKVFEEELPLSEAKHSDKAEEPGEEHNSAVGVLPENHESIFEAEEKDVADDTLFEGDNTHSHEPKLAEINFDMMDTGKWLLKVIGGPNNGAEFSMQAGNAYTLGTDPNVCDLVFQDNSVSRQHARLTVSADDVVTIEDLKSRNGTMVDGERIEGKTTLAPNIYVAMGTTSFVVYDREGEMQTIISPLLPSIVKALKGESKKEEAAPQGPSEAEINAEKAKKEAELAAAAAAESETRRHRMAHYTSVGILVAILVGIFTVVGIGISSLFQSAPVVEQNPVDTDKALADVLAPFPGVKYSFNKSTGRLLLVGHVLTATDKNQLIYSLQGLNFIVDIDDSGVIIDEYVLNEANQGLARNPEWRGVTVQSPTPGHFVLAGYLKTRDQAEQVWDYITRNFSYLDLLENNIVVEQDLIATIQNALINHGFSTVKIQLSNGEVVLSGNALAEKQEDLQKLVAAFQALKGVRSVKNLVSAVAPEEAIVNISSKYQVTGSSSQDGRITVVINGRILNQGDVLDGMVITQVRPHIVFLEKDNTTYRIDY